MHGCTCEWMHVCMGGWSTGRTLAAPQSLATRLKENMEKLTEERDQRAAAENREKEQNKRLQRQLRDVKEEMGELAKKEAEASRKKHELVRASLLSPHELGFPFPTAQAHPTLPAGDGPGEPGSCQPEPAVRPEAGLQAHRGPAGCHRG